MKVLAIIQARWGSTRLPGKVAMDLNGQPVLAHIIDRVRQASTVNAVMLATTILEEDEQVAAIAQSKNAPYYRGSVDDVLDRFYEAANIRMFQHIVRITGDCPFMDARVIDQVVKKHLEARADYTSNINPPTFPDGLDVEVMTFAALEKAHQSAQLASEREHVTPYIRKNPKLFSQVNVACPVDHSAKRWTLDNPEDWQFIRKIFGELFPKKPAFGTEDILAVLKKHPEWEEINRHIDRNAGYQQSLREDKKIGLTDSVIKK